MERLGVLKDSITDARLGRPTFVSHCILDQNACVRGLALISSPAMLREVLRNRCGVAVP